MTTHLAMAVLYYWYGKTHVSDAFGYYFDRYQLGRMPFTIGTLFAFKVVRILRYDLNATLLDCFLLYQGLSFIGIAILMRTFQEINLRLRTQETTWQNMLLFLPSVQFWPSAVGKDSPLFLAISLCLWATLKLPARSVAFAVSLLIMILFRAHIALVIVISIALASTLHPRFSLGRRIALLIAAIAGAIFLFPSVHTTIGVNFADSASVAAFAERQAHIAATSGGATTIGNAPIPIRFVDLLFRPLFFDAQDIFAIVASLENVCVVLLFIYFLRNFRIMLFLIRRVFFVRFCLSFSAIVIAVLTATYYNVGTGIRERVMAFPSVFCVLVAMWSLRQLHGVDRRRNGGDVASPTQAYNPQSGSAAVEH
jgi:hypothetical protein